MALPTSSRRRIIIGGLAFSQQQINRIDPETEKKLQQIIKQNGILTIDYQEYLTDIKDLEDLGELGNGTSGHVVKMKHRPTDKIIAVKVNRIFFVLNSHEKRFPLITQH